jgi:hypothetical protein
MKSLIAPRPVTLPRRRLFRAQHHHYRPYIPILYDINSLVSLS